MIDFNMDITKYPNIQIKKYVIDGLKKGMFLLEGEIKKGLGTVEGRPKVKTGNLRRSISSYVESRGDDITGSVGSKVCYGRILELGGRRANGSYQRPMPFIKPEFEDQKNINNIKQHRYNEHILILLIICPHCNS